jgi:hypothetical protein
MANHKRYYSTAYDGLVCLKARMVLRDRPWPICGNPREDETGVHYMYVRTSMDLDSDWDRSSLRMRMMGWCWKEEWPYQGCDCGRSVGSQANDDEAGICVEAFLEIFDGYH